MEEEAREGRAASAVAAGSRNVARIYKSPNKRRGFCELAEELRERSQGGEAEGGGEAGAVILSAPLPVPARVHVHVHENTRGHRRDAHS